MNVTLEVVSGKTDLERVELSLPAVLGRGEHSDLVVAHSEVSRRHCRMFEFRGKVYLQDMDSRNGTYIYNQRLQKQEMQLLPGDRFSVGPVTFKIHYEMMESSGGSSRMIPKPRGSSMELPIPRELMGESPAEAKTHKPGVLMNENTGKG